MSASAAHVVLLLEDIHEDAMASLRERCVVQCAPEPVGSEIPDDLLEGVSAIITRGGGKVTRELVARIPALMLVARCGVGVDNIDLDALSERGVRVINAPGSTTATTAEHTMLLMLALERQLVSIAGSVRNGDWQARNSYAGDECFGKSLGIVGLGAIGSRVAELATAFGMHVRYWNRTPRETPYEAASLNEVLEQSDIVSLHVALTAEMRGLIGAEQIGRMRRGARLVNAARGALVDREALLAALDAGTISGYAADGVDPQPPANGDTLVQHPRVLITPHAAALTQSTYARTCAATVERIIDYLDGEEVDEECVVV